MTVSHLRVSACVYVCALVCACVCACVLVCLQIAEKLTRITLIGCKRVCLVGPDYEENYEIFGHADQASAVREAYAGLAPLKSPAIELCLEYFTMNESLAEELTALHAAGGWGPLSLKHLTWPEGLTLQKRLPPLRKLHFRRSGAYTY